MTDWSEVWLVVPVYNEGQVIEDVVRHARETFPNVVCVDDGSRDNSADGVRAGGAHLVQHPVNLGQGAAIQTGIEYARKQPGAEYFVTFDADGQHRVEDVLSMLERLRSEPLDIIVGTRFHGDTAHIPWIKRVVLKTVVMLSRRTRKLGLTDAHNGLRVFNRAVAERINITLNGMGHASEIVEMIDHHKWRVAEEPVTILYTEYSMAKGQSLINGVNILFDTMLKSKAH
ncbi:glycosyltransferase family 2 protein [Saccharothrix sp. 6-C]|uniref:Glycosyl transferase family 2 n=1 Tax=Saccharothrix texasensis TaxID=103734 RepID=A0A3N1H9I7_9PSEU|nr:MULTISPECIES: glycosyltransferase family 2 protein [Saccharothrix]QQQ76590.1 glycosyltransferase family 2 protein [Saccharothrix sp. 6-C]ROP39173.1 glycosyl transferase family 2 [Saccharothrix texasensis]